MHDEDIFRWVLVVGFVVFMPIGLYFRIRSQATGEKLDRRQEGMFILLTLRPVAGVALLGTLAFIIDPAWMSWSAVRIPVAIRWVGVGIGLAAAVLLITVFKTLGPNLTDTVVTRERHTLVTRGIYHHVRHPLYTATALAVVGNALVTANWFLLVTGAMIFVLLVIRTRREEERLIERFGEEYRAYMKTTGRFLPRVGK